MAGASNSLCALYNKYFSFFTIFYLSKIFYENDYNVLLYIATPFLLFFAYKLIPTRKLRDGGKYRAIIIGGGFSGINAGIRLAELGVDYLILEKSASLGGTWRDNTYPGAACDVPSHLYSFSFYPNPWWSRKFAPRSEISCYLEDVASHFRIYPHFRFNQEVLSADWDEVGQIWTVTTKGGETFVGNFVVSCCGELHVPNIPEFRGKKDFMGEIFHSARWNHEVDLAGKNVAVIGTGASAVQIVPAVADKVQELYVFQRTPVWCPPIKKYQYPKLLQLLFAIFPPAMVMHRWYFFWYFELKFLPLFDKRKKDTLKAIMHKLTGYIKTVVKDSKVAEKLTPTYDFGCKAISPSEEYLQTFNRENVHLIAEKIDKITSKGIKAGGGEIHLDIIILATGFDLEKSYKAFHTRGRYGKVLQEEWGDTPNAYKGAVFPNVPNMFLVLGPNTGLAHNSRLFMIECQVNYAIDCIRKLVKSGHKSMDVKTKVYQDYQTKLAKRMKDRVFASVSCDSYYKNARGIVFAMWPGDLTNFWSICRRCNLQDYNLK